MLLFGVSHIPLPSQSPRAFATTTHQQFHNPNAYKFLLLRVCLLLLTWFVLYMGVGLTLIFTGLGLGILRVLDSSPFLLVPVWYTHCAFWIIAVCLVVGESAWGFRKAADEMEDVLLQVSKQSKEGILSPSQLGVLVVLKRFRWIQSALLWLIPLYSTLWLLHALVFPMFWFMLFVALRAASLHGVALVYIYTSESNREKKLGRLLPCCRALGTRRSDLTAPLPSQFQVMLYKMDTSCDW